MLINELKAKIESGTIDHSMIIFQISDIDWIPRQYIKEMSRLFDCKIEYYDVIPNVKRDIFGFDNALPVIKVASISKLDTIISKTNDLVVITKDIDKDVKNTLDQYIVEVPKLVDWQVEDYALGMLDGMVEDNVKLLCRTCNYDIHRIEQEIKRLVVFEPKQRDAIFNQLFLEGGYGVAFNNNAIFEFCDAIVQKDVGKVRSIYNMIVYQDIEPLGVVTLLYKKFKQIASVQLNRNATPDMCKMSEKQFKFYKWKMCSLYTDEQLVRNLKFLTDLDRRLKDGTLGFNATQTLFDHQFIDYVVTHIMCR